MLDARIVRPELVRQIAWMSPTRHCCWHVGERQHVWFPEFAGLSTRCVVVRAGELVLL